MAPVLEQLAPRRGGPAVVARAHVTAHAWAAAYAWVVTRAWVATSTHARACVWGGARTRTCMGGHAVDQIVWVGAQAGEQGQVVRAAQHVDRVQLQQPYMGQHATYVACVDPARRARLGEALRGQRDAT